MQSCIVASPAVLQVTPVKDSVCINTFLLDNSHVKDYARVFDMFYTESIENRMKGNSGQSIKRFMKDELYNYLFRFAKGQTIDVFTDSEFFVQSLQMEFPLVSFRLLDSGNITINFDLSIPEFIEEEVGPSFVSENLYLGSESDACSEEVLKERGINVIVNCTDEVYNFFEDADLYNGTKYTYYRVPMRDSNSQQIFPTCHMVSNGIREEKSLDDIVKSIEQHIEQGDVVLVHCAAGISRSVSIVLALLMRRGKSYDEAFLYLHSKRNKIEPNLGFMSQLLRYQQFLNK